MAYGPDRKHMTGARAAAIDTRTRAREGVGEIDVGLRNYMLRVYNYMALGVALTGAISMLMAMNPQLMMAVAVGPFKWVLFIGIIGMGFFAPRLMINGSTATAQIAFWVYAAMWGALISPMFYVYTEGSIARVFFITAAAFAGLSLYGYTTKRDLGPIGAFLAMATIGLLIAVVVNLFLQSAMFDMLVSIAVVVVFAGLTAYETQQIKNWYYGGDAADVAKKKAVFGAFLLYGSFVTLFIWLLHIFGVARD